ncbi:MAG: putative tRNA-dihydrouridine synthase [Microgenomates bacterium OLB22]|nr:MAG: putative tRNA-dihydrouridine synthase [Microgenomates bacterium OLB22]
MRSVWTTSEKPLFVQAPLEDVSDSVFRQMLLRIGPPDIFFTEFTNVDGLVSEGSFQVGHRLDSTPGETPLIAQIWGSDEQHYYEAAKYIASTGRFAGIDINMGCPQKDVVKKGLCSALINDHERAARIIATTQKGAKDLPVSVKTRIGFREIQTEEWIGFLLSQNLAALTIHLRTVREMSKVPAHWDEMLKVVDLRDRIAPDTIIIGNGDITTRAQALRLVSDYGCDGVMIGRGMMKYLPIFSTDDAWWADVSYRIPYLIDHVKLFRATWEGKKPFDHVKKYIRMYLYDVPSAADMRLRLMETESYEELLSEIEKIPLLSSRT